MYFKNLMRLEEPGKLREIWEYSISQGANLVLMRHAPKSGSENSDVSTEGIDLTKQYSTTLRAIFEKTTKWRLPQLVCTSKTRTSATLKLLFPWIDSSGHCRPPNLSAPAFNSRAFELVEKQHKKVGHWRGYALNQTYYFYDGREKLGINEELHNEISERMARGFRKLLVSAQRVPTIYCGHSPSIEVGCERLLNISLAEMGGFLNPLDSIHLKLNEDNIEFVARINPIVGYMDIESESYYRQR